MESVGAGIRGTDTDRQNTKPERLEYAKSNNKNKPTKRGKN